MVPNDLFGAVPTVAPAEPQPAPSSTPYMKSVFWPGPPE